MTGYVTPRYEPAVYGPTDDDEREPAEILGAEATTCRDCGAVVVDQAHHDRWHERLDGLLGGRST